MLITIIFAIFMQVVVARKWSNSSSNLLKVSSPTCSSDTAQVPLNVFFGYNSDGKTEQSKSDGLKGFNSFKNWLNDYPDRSSFSYKTTRLNGYMWVGSMIKNSDFSNSNAFKVLYDEINTSGMPETLYIEYVTGDPMKGFGAIFTTKSNNFVEAQKAVKLWSEGKAYNSYKGYKYYKAKVVCYLSYNKRKSIVNDNEAGNCNYFLVKSGENVADTANIGRYGFIFSGTR